MQVPVDVGLKAGDGVVALLVAQDERVLLGLPNVAVLVPGHEMFLQMPNVGGHARHHASLDLLQLLVLC